MELKDINEGLGAMLKVDPPWKITAIDVQPANEVVDIHIDYDRGAMFECPECGQRCKVHDSRRHRIRHLDWFQYRCYLNIQVPRVKCKDHGVKVVSNLPWGYTGSHFSFFFEQRIMRLSQEMSMIAVAREVGESDRTLWRIFSGYVDRAINEQMDLKAVNKIGVDETAIRRGHKYVTIFTDMDNGNVILVREGRKKEVFKDLYSWLKEKGCDPENISLFSMDMSKSYKAGSKAYFSKSEVVFDRFHIKKAVNEAVDKVRKHEVRYCEDLKKTKYIWLKNECNLNYHQKIKLNNFLAESTLDTAKAYQMKTGFDTLWNVQSRAVEPLLDTWMDRAIDSSLKPFKYLVNTIKNNYAGIIKSMKTGITNAAAEGLNSMVQMVKSRARGFRNLGNFMAMIYCLGNDFNFTFHRK
jgi:transposase